MDLDGIENTLQKVGELYTANLHDYGFNSKSVGWGDEESHYSRFEKLAQILTPGGEGTVNDWGCGYGAMFKYLDNIPGVRLTKYYGYDISEKMLSGAKEYVKDKRANWVKSQDITNRADYSFVSGTFNVRFKANDEIWKEYIQEIILQLAKMSKKAFGFNLLSTYVDWKEDHLYYGDPLFFFDFCKRHVSRHVSLLHDYPLYEWTILVRMGERG